MMRKQGLSARLYSQEQVTAGDLVFQKAEASDFQEDWLVNQ
jgi:hypothetical protein